MAGSPIVSSTYEEENGNLLSTQYANGYTYLYEYDNLDRVIEIRMTNPSGTEYLMYQYEYDAEGNLAVEYDIREDLNLRTIVTRYFYDLSRRFDFLWLCL